MENLNNKLKQAINNHYWYHLEPNSNGYGDPLPLSSIHKRYGIELDWDSLLLIFRDCDYMLGVKS